MKNLSFARRMGFWAGAGLLLAGAYAACAQPSISNFSVTITQPTNGSTFTAPANVQIDALTFDTADDVAEVAFTAASARGMMPPIFLLGSVSNGVPVGPSGSHQKLYSFTWTNAMAGMWLLRAEAMRSNGQEIMSPPVTITVQGGRVLSVDIAWPTNGAVFAAPANIELIAGASESGGGAVADVQFFDGTNSLGVVSNGVVVDPPGSPGLPPGSKAYFLNWTNVPAGTHVLTAVAMDTNGQSAVSAPVTITVQGSNLPPVVRITSPPNNAVFRAPVNIALLAFALDPAGISNVQFFAGSNSLGFGLPVPPSVRPGGGPGPTPGPPIFPTNMYLLIWSNAPVGSNVLTAVATDNSGIAATSAPVNITVLPPPPPPTNEPAEVRIVATDPIAIRGTNCWPWLGLSNAPPTWSNWTSPNAHWRWFTNCGPKDATFTVFRCGTTNSDLTVAYAIGGTASNGVDYVALPGVVTIPAGQRGAMITVIPTDETNTATETVILSLDPSTNTPPEYVLGFPHRAEALIIGDNPPHPVLTGGMLGDRSFRLNAGGPDGAWFRVDYSADCVNWAPVCTNQVVNGSIDFADPEAGNSPARWYRTVPQANGPSN